MKLESAPSVASVRGPKASPRVVATVEEAKRLLEREEICSVGRFGRMIGSSPAMQKMYAVLRRVGATEASVLLTGETGSGKELAARSLHDLSPRRSGPFLAVNCGAISPNMIESEIFGHERGSFTGAAQRHCGIFERPAGGTLFLDEITEMTQELQVKLLRVLESGTLVRVGGETDVPVDVRVIAATNLAPEGAIAEGKLRPDLFYRLAVVQVHMPPLRERGDDVWRIAEHLLREFNAESATSKAFTADAIAALRAHAWPGNVRELKNVVQGAFIMADGSIGARDLPFHGYVDDGRIAESPSQRAADTQSSTPANERDASGDLHIKIGTSAEEAERLVILATLRACGGMKNETARVLSVSLKTLYNRLHKYGDMLPLHIASDPAQQFAEWRDHK